jgi:hypothetical protein
MVRCASPVLNLYLLARPLPPVARTKVARTWRDAERRIDEQIRFPRNLLGTTPFEP